VAAEDDEIDLLLAGELQNALGCLALHEDAFGLETGLPEAVAQGTEVGLGLGPLDLPGERVDGRHVVSDDRSLEDPQEGHPPLKGVRKGHCMGRDALRQRRAIHGGEEVLKHWSSW
jgi:hypothetical protein